MEASEKLKRPRVRVQSLPAPTAENHTSTPKSRITPTAKSVLANYAEADIPVLGRAMADSLCTSFAHMAGRPLPKLSDHPLAVEVTGRHLGRCLWSWSDIPAQAGDLRELSAHLIPQALRPHTAFPGDLQVISPRLSQNLLLATYAGTEAAIARWLRRPKATPLTNALALTGYGAVQDKRLISLRRAPEPVQRAGYNSRQSLALDLAERDALPFSAAILRDTLYEVDLASRLREAKPRVTEALKELADILAEERPHISEELLYQLRYEEPPYIHACDLIVSGEWDFPLSPLGSDGNITEATEDDYLSLTCRMIVATVTGFGRHMEIPGDELVALACLTGVSPAAYAAYAIDDLRRRGTTYLGPNGIAEMMDFTEAELADYPQVPQLLKVLDQQREQLITAGAMAGERVIQTTRLIRCRDVRVAHEWGIGNRIRGEVDL